MFREVFDPVVGGVMGPVFPHRVAPPVAAPHYEDRVAVEGDRVLLEAFFTRWEGEQGEHIGGPFGVYASRRNPHPPCQLRNGRM